MFEVSMKPERVNPLDIDKERIRFLYPTRSIIAAEKLDLTAIATEDLLRGVERLTRIYSLGGYFRNPQGGMLIGEPGSGRKMLLETFHASLQSRGELDPNARILQVSLDEAISRRSLVSKSLVAMRYPIQDGGTGIETFKQARLLRMYLSKREIRLWVVHNADIFVRPKQNSANLLPKHTAELAIFLSSISKELKLPLLLVGTKKLRELPRTSSDLASCTDIEIPMGDLSTDDNWPRMLSGFKKRLLDDFGIQSQIFDQVCLGMIAQYVGTSKLKLARVMLEVLMIVVRDQRQVATVDDLKEALSYLANIESTENVL
jgi:hypothetical protein